MKTINKIYIFLVLGMLVIACKPEIEVPAPVSGSADFTKYVSVGNSLTAGYSDAGFGNFGLYAEAQAQSFPKVVADQMNEVNPISFTQPDVPGDGSGHIYLSSLDVTTSPPGIGFGFVNPDPNWLDKIPGDYNNLGIPGIKVRDIDINGYGASPTQGNPFFYRILGESEATKSYLDVVKESNPTFFTSWIGGGDILSYATSGGASGIADITPESKFKQNYDALVDALTEEGAKGMVITLPDPLMSPLFTLVPYNALVFTADQAAQVNAIYAGMIDPGLEQAVTQQVLMLAVTEEALITQVIPDVATGVVFETTKAELIAGGATEQEAIAGATAYVQSPEGQATIDALITALEADLQNHLLGIHAGHTDLEPIYQQIDQILATNTDLQQAIAAGTQQLGLAYAACKAGQTCLLSERQIALIDGGIAQGMTLTKSQLQAAGIYPVFAAGPNPLVIEQEVTAQNPLGIRQMRSSELVVGSALFLGELEPEKAPLPKADEFILEDDEIAVIYDAMAAYNDIIRGYASADIGVIESEPILTQAIDGVYVDGVSITGDFVTGGFFSVDGIHLTPRGYAYTAKRFIEEINKKFASTIPSPVINNYRGVILP